MTTTETVTAQPVHDMAERQRVKAQADAIAAVLQSTDSPVMPKRIAAALALAQRVDQLRSETVDLNALASNLAAADTDKKWAVELDRAIAETHRRAALDTVVQALNGARLSGVLKQAITDDFPVIASRLKAAFDAAATELTAAAGDLPGPDPLNSANAQAVLASGSASAWTGAQQATARLLDLARVFNDGGLIHRTGQAAVRCAGLVPVVDTDDVGPEMVNRLTATPTGDPEHRAAVLAVQAYATAVFKHGPEAGLLRTARGDFPGVRISLAADDADLRARCERLRVAHTRSIREVRPTARAMMLPR